MTDTNYTAMLLIVDRSGSMSTIRDDMVGGLEQLIRAQVDLPGMTTIDIVTFDNTPELTHHFADPRDVQVELVPRGGTALYDAIGWAFNGFGQALAELPEHARPGTVLVTIVTDGEENSSLEYSAEAVKQIITHQEAAFDWDVSYLGANQDAVLAAAQIGIEESKAMNYGLNSVAGVMAAEIDKNARRRQGDRSGYTEWNRAQAMGDEGGRE